MAKHELTDEVLKHLKQIAEDLPKIPIIKRGKVLTKKVRGKKLLARGEDTTGGGDDVKPNMIYKVPVFRDHLSYLKVRWFKLGSEGTAEYINKVNREFQVIISSQLSDDNKESNQKNEDN